MTKPDPTEAARDELMKEILGFLRNLNDAHVSMKTLQAALMGKQISQEQIVAVREGLFKLRSHGDRTSSVLYDWWTTHCKLFEPTLQ
jgi:hypothetical protein